MSKYLQFPSEPFNLAVVIRSLLAASIEINCPILLLHFSPPSGGTATSEKKHPQKRLNSYFSIENFRRKLIQSLSGDWRRESQSVVGPNRRRNGNATIASLDNLIDFAINRRRLLLPNRFLLPFYFSLRWRLRYFLFQSFWVVAFRRSPTYGEKGNQKNNISFQ